MGTPSEEQWPHLTSLPYWRTSFPEWPPMSMHSLVPSVGPQGHSLLQQLFKYNPVERISAVDSLVHPYVAPLLPQQEGLLSSVVTPAGCVRPAAKEGAAGLRSATPESWSQSGPQLSFGAQALASSSSSSLSSSSSGPILTHAALRAHKVTPALQREGEGEAGAAMTAGGAAMMAGPAGSAGGLLLGLSSVSHDQAPGAGKRSRRSSVSSTTTDMSAHQEAQEMQEAPPAKKRPSAAPMAKDVVTSLDFSGLQEGCEGGELDGDVLTARVRSAHQLDGEVLTAALGKVRVRAAKAAKGADEVEKGEDLKGKGAGEKTVRRSSRLK